VCSDDRRQVLAVLLLALLGLPTSAVVAQAPFGVAEDRWIPVFM
jgi:hypothetical protein